MLAEAYQVADVLMLVGNIAPLAIYFLILGLVNSHASPCVVSSRTDFVALTTVLVPVLFWPLPTLVGSGRWELLAVGFGIAAGAFTWLLRRTGEGFVIYNISEPRCIRIVEGALHRLGLTGNWDGVTWRSDRDDLVVRVSKFALLRNVSLHVETTDRDAGRTAQHLAQEMERDLASVAQLPSTMGACLVVIGLGLFLLPMCMVGRHIHDIVEAVSSLFGG
jgi:hypothetical protein